MIFYCMLSSGTKFAMDQWYAELKNIGILGHSRRRDGLRFDTDTSLMVERVPISLLDTTAWIFSMPRPCISSIKRRQKKQESKS
ncbi:hypothetical protein CIG19_20065 [Enterobacterales bacterium CwR94]|nr:hypothetical protein CIG19_20065 [Enterobacterales bacterium CwR94]